MSARTRWSLQSRLKSKHCGTTHGIGPGLVKRLGFLESMPPPNDIAVFVDIYGTLVEDRAPRPSTVDEMRTIPWIPGAIDALKRFEAIGYQPHVILSDEKVQGQFVDLFTLSDMHLALYYRAKALGARLR